VWLLVVMDPTAMRWVISTLILVLIGVLATGWRWSRPPSLPSTVAVGGASGLTGGMTGLGGPPVILFWMAGQDGPRVLRANIIVFLTFVGMFNLVGYVVGDLMTGERIALGVTLIPAYGARCCSASGCSGSRRHGSSGASRSGCAPSPRSPACRCSTALL